MVEFLKRKIKKCIYSISLFMFFFVHVFYNEWYSQIIYPLHHYAERE